MGFFEVAVLVIAIAAQFFFARKKPAGPEDARASTLDQFSAPTAEIGREIPVVFGTVRVRAPNVVWYGDLTIEPVVVRS